MNINVIEPLDGGQYDIAINVTADGGGPTSTYTRAYDGDAV